MQKAPACPVFNLPWFPLSPPRRNILPSPHIHIILWIVVLAFSEPQGVTHAYLQALVYPYLRAWALLHSAIQLSTPATATPLLQLAFLIVKCPSHSRWDSRIMPWEKPLNPEYPSFQLPFSAPTALKKKTLFFSACLVFSILSTSGSQKSFFCYPSSEVFSPDKHF